MKKVLLIITALFLMGCGEKVTRYVVVKAANVADSLLHDQGNHFGQDSTHVPPGKGK